MRCPECGAEAQVAQVEKYADRIRRRRECTACGHRFTTDEHPRAGGTDLALPTLELAEAYNRGESLRAAVEDQATAYKVREVARALRPDSYTPTHAQEEATAAHAHGGEV